MDRAELIAEYAPKKGIGTIDEGTPCIVQRRRMTNMVLARAAQVQSPVLIVSIRSTRSSPLCGTPGAVAGVGTKPPGGAWPGVRWAFQTRRKQSSPRGYRPCRWRRPTGRAV